MTYNALGGSTLVSGPDEAALRIRTSSEPPVTLEISAAVASSFAGSAMSVSRMWMFLRFVASSSSGPAVLRLLIRAKTLFVGSEL